MRRRGGILCQSELYITTTKVCIYGHAGNGLLDRVSTACSTWWSMGYSVVEFSLQSWMVIRSMVYP